MKSLFPPPESDQTRSGSFHDKCRCSTRGISFHPSLSYSCIVLICCVLLGCSTEKETRLLEYRAALTQLDILERQYPTLRNPQLLSYISYLTQRLNAQTTTGKSYRVTLLKDHQRFAYHLGSGLIVLSSGLIQQLDNEAQLAFLIAHEMAHYQLKHSSQEHRFSLSSHKKGLQAEIEADTLALGIMALAGYDPRVSVYALSRAYLGRDGKNSISHPSFEERIAHIGERIRSSGWKPPGVVQKREFVRFQRALNTPL